MSLTLRSLKVDEVNQNAYIESRSGVTSETVISKWKFDGTLIWYLDLDVHLYWWDIAPDKSFLILEANTLMIKIGTNDGVVYGTWGLTSTNYNLFLDIAIMLDSSGFITAGS